MNLTSVRSTALSNENTSFLSYLGLTVESSSDGYNDHGCMVLEQQFNPQNNPDNIISKQVRFWVQTIAYAGIGPLLFIVGVPANILSAVVFYKQGLEERINFCIFCLALVDLVVITDSFCRTAGILFREFSGFVIKYLVRLAGFVWVSMFLSTVIAAERCFCVVSPLRAQRTLSTRTLAVIVISISVILLTGKLVTAGTKHTEACVFDPKTNSTSYTFHVTEFYLNNKDVFDIIRSFVYATALPVFFFVVIVITTVITTVKLHSAVRWRQQTASASVTQPTGSSEYHMVSLTRMLIATSVLFVVCLCPILSFEAATFWVQGISVGGRYQDLSEVVWAVILMLRFANSSLNFFIYYQMGSRFRQTLKQLLSSKGTKIRQRQL